MSETARHHLDGADSAAPGPDRVSPSRPPCAGCAKRLEALRDVEDAIAVTRVHAVVWAGTAIGIALAAACVAVWALLAARQQAPAAEYEDD